MITLNELLKGIEDSRSILDDAVSVLGNINQNNVSVQEVNAIIDRIDSGLSNVSKVIKLMSEATSALPRYLAWVNGPCNMLKQSLGNASIDIMEIHEFTTKKSGSDRITITEKIKLNVKANNSIIRLKSELNNARFILNQMYVKLQ